MSATTADTIVRTLTGAEENARRGLPTRARDVRPGTRTNVWGLPGTWAAWSPGPEQGTWWLQPRDADAIDVYRALAEKPSRGQPVTVGVAQGCIAVRTRDLHLTGGAR